MTIPDFKTIKNDPALSLRDDERALMRARLLERMRTQPSVPSPFAFFIHIRYAALAAVLIVSTTGVSFAAEGALPGETLYDFKVGVNERVEYLLAPGIKAKGKVAVRQAEERIKEVEVLAVEGKLDAVQAERAAEQAEAHIELAIANADVLEEAGDELAAHEIETKLTATLSAHTELLEAQAEALEGDSAHRVRALAAVLTEVSSEQDAQESFTDADEEEMKAYARATYARAKKSLDELERGIDDAGVPAETAAELSNEHERLSGELARNEDLAEVDDETAQDAYTLLEKRSVRALTFLRAVRDIARETDKEVVLALESRAEAGTSSSGARMTKEAPALMMTTTLSLEAATSTENINEEEGEADVVQETAQDDEEREEPELRLQLWLRDSE